MLNNLNNTQSRFPALVINLNEELQVIGFDKTIYSLQWSEDLNWTRPYISENRRGPRPKGFPDILENGDLVWIQRGAVERKFFSFSNSRCSRSPSKLRPQEWSC